MIEALLIAAGFICLGIIGTIIGLLFRITYLSGYQKGIAKGRDICMKEFDALKKDLGLKE